LVAAERAGRRCFAMELDPAYCDVAVRRWEMATGKTAQRSSPDDAAA
jgi:DNA modification methylase